MSMGRNKGHAHALHFVQCYFSYGLSEITFSGRKRKEKFKNKRNFLKKGNRGLKRKKTAESSTSLPNPHEQVYDICR